MRCSLSRRRRSVRRAQAQADTIRNDSNSPATEQVTEDALSTAEKAATNYATNYLRTDVCNLPGPAEQAVPDVILDPPLAPQPAPVPQFLPQQEHDAYTAEEADVPKDNNNAEKATESIKNKSLENSAKQRLYNFICYFCDKEFETEDLIKDHTEFEHRSRRARIKRVKPQTAILSD